MLSKTKQPICYDKLQATSLQLKWNGIKYTALWRALFGM